MLPRIRATEPTLILCAHGTRDPAGAAVIEEIAQQVAQRVPKVRVELAYVDVQVPEIAAAVARADSHAEASVVVPLLLGNGYHVQVDIARAIAGRSACCAPTVGPAPELATVLTTRLAEAGVADDEAVVVAAAGSSRPGAIADAQCIRDYLAGVRTGPVGLGFCSAAAPTVPDAVTALRRRWRGRIAVAPYLIGPGYFHSQLSSAGADVVAAPLGSHPVVVNRALAAYHVSVNQPVIADVSSQFDSGGYS
ncbi:MAG: sirohydrochlorin chelatase [Propioniciclava sp.]